MEIVIASWIDNSWIIGSKANKEMTKQKLMDMFKGEDCRKFDKRLVKNYKIGLVWQERCRLKESEFV